MYQMLLQQHKVSQITLVQYIDEISNQWNQANSKIHDDIALHFPTQQWRKTTFNLVSFPQQLHRKHHSNEVSNPRN